jgi:hypothetical protein
MSPKMIMACFFIFIVGTMLAALCSGRWLIGGEINIFNALASFNTMSVQAGGGWQAPKTLSTYWDGLVTMFTWNYPFLESSWAIFVKIPLWVVSIGVIWGMIQLFVTVIQGLVGFVRNLI